jgi:hypothetical protein
VAGSYGGPTGPASYRQFARALAGRVDHGELQHLWFVYTWLLRRWRCISLERYGRFASVSPERAAAELLVLEQASLIRLAPAGPEPEDLSDIELVPFPLDPVIARRRRKRHEEARRG